MCVISTGGFNSLSGTIILLLVYIQLSLVNTLVIGSLYHQWASVTGLCSDLLGQGMCCSVGAAGLVLLGGYVTKKCHTQMLNKYTK